MWISSIYLPKPGETAISPSNMQHEASPATISLGRFSPPAAGDNTKTGRNHQFRTASRVEGGYSGKAGDASTSREISGERTNGPCSLGGNKVCAGSEERACGFAIAASNCLSGGIGSGGIGGRVEAARTVGAIGLRAPKVGRALPEADPLGTTEEGSKFRAATGSRGRIG